MFTHGANGVITIGAYRATLDNFLLLEPSYRLPDGALWQMYVPGSKHVIGYGLYQRNEGATWDAGDVYIANEESYSAMQPDMTPDIEGFEADLVGAFDSNYLAINSLYSGWPLFIDALRHEQWSVADLLLADSYVNEEITTDTYWAIVDAARANYIPMALQGRPNYMPLPIEDVASVIVILPSGNLVESGRLGATEGVGQIIVPVPTTTDDCPVVASEVITIASPVSIMTDELIHVPADDATPVIV